MMPTNILNLPDYRVLGIEERADDYHISADLTHVPRTCPVCRSAALRGHGRNEQVIRDLPIHGKRVGIYVDTRRWRCVACGKTFMQPLPAVDTKRDMTKRLVRWIGQQTPRRTFTSLAEDIGIDEKTVRNIFRDYVNDLERRVRFEVPRWMGIDEIHIIKKPRCIICNVEHNTAVEVLRDRTKKTVMGYFQSLKGRPAVRYVAMDMWTPYREAVEALMPQATIVIDKFHVVRMANEALETVRKALRAELEPKRRRGLMHDRFVLLKRRRDLTHEEYLKFSGWTANYPLLGEAYDAKEAFYGIWDLDSRAKAERAYALWKDALNPEIREAFHPLVRAVDNWRPYIFTYFDHPITNAYTESLNNLIRVMNRLGRGYSFDALRAKILFSEGLHKTKRPAFKRIRGNAPGTKDTTPRWEYFCRSELVIDENRERNYGTDLDALIERVESGEW